MQEFILDVLKTINIAQLIAIAGMFWFFDKRLSAKIDKICDRIDKISYKF